MCLAIPGQLLSVKEDEDPLFRVGMVNFGGVRKEVNLAMVPEAKKDDYVLIHVGVALSVIDEEEAQLTLRQLAEMGEMLDDEPTGSPS